MIQIQIPWQRWEQSGRVGGRAELHDVRLFSLNTVLRDFGAEPPYVADMEVEASVQREDGSAHVVVSAEYTLKARAFGPEQDRSEADTEPELVAAEVNFTMLALYSLRPLDDDADEVSPDELEAFAVSTGLMALHPYARELIQDQTARIGLPALTVGVAQIAKID